MRSPPPHASNLPTTIMPSPPPPLSSSTAFRTLLLLLLLLQSLLPVAAATASPLPPPLPLLNQDVLVQVSLLLITLPPPHHAHPIPVDLRFTCASTSAALTLNSTYTLHSSSFAHEDALSSKQKKAQPAWAFVVDRHRLQKLRPCWVIAHAMDPPHHQLGLEVVSPPATAMQLSIVLKIHLPSSSSSSSSSLDTSWLSMIKQYTHHAHTQFLELLITQGWLRRGELSAEDVLALFLFVLLFLCFSVVMGGVIVTWLWGKEEEEEEGGEQEEEEEENEQPAARVKRTSLLSSSSFSSLALVTTTTQRRRNSSSNSNNQLIPTISTTSSKKRGSTTTAAAAATPSPPGDASSSLFLDVPFSSQWQCVAHNRRATPTLLKDRDLDTVAAAAAGGGGGGGGGGRKGRQQQQVPMAKDVATRLLVDDHKLRGVVLSAKT